jgi:hypothetical protein
MRSLFVVLLLVVLATSSNAAPLKALWGATGHQITAMIGQNYLQSNATANINRILANVSGEMYQVSSWADNILDEPQWKWSAPLHYINTPSWQCSYIPSQDCGVDENGLCVANAVANYSNQLNTPTLPYNQMEDAVRFVIHFHGDIHQPLHVGFGADEGGNTIYGTYFGASSNLHEVWDTGIISGRIQYSFGGSLSSYVSYIISQINGPWAQMAAEWRTCNSTDSEDTPLTCPNGWANESADLACEYAYTDQNGNHIENNFDLGNAYYEFVKNIVDQQLAKGGVRLASTLNKIWPSSD